MIYQLPSGRTVELSIEQYLSLEEGDIQELNGVRSSYFIESENPFQNLFSGSVIDIDIDDPNLPDEVYEMLVCDEEITLELPDIDDADKLEDKYFHSDDI